jgi:hypothetical protein
VLETCALRLCAQSSYQQAEDNFKTLLGIAVGHSCLHRWVQQTTLPDAQAPETVEAASIDGGKIRLRSETGGTGEWRDYKAVSLHDSVCAAFFQEPDALQDWSEQQPLSPIFTCVGDGHPGVWKLATPLGGKQVVVRRQVLDWYHLVENLYKVGGSQQRLHRLKTLLWYGQVEAVSDELAGLNRPQAQRFREYLHTHRQRIPNYATYARQGIAIGSGSVESQIKQIGARVKLTGASWKRENVPQILRLRCAYLNHDPCLSISA